MQTMKTNTIIGEVLTPIYKTAPKPRNRSIRRTRAFIPIKIRKICNANQLVLIIRGEDKRKIMYRNKKNDKRMIITELRNPPYKIKE